MNLLDTDLLDRILKNFLIHIFYSSFQKFYSIFCNKIIQIILNDFLMSLIFLVFFFFLFVLKNIFLIIEI